MKRGQTIQTWNGQKIEVHGGMHRWLAFVNDAVVSGPSDHA